MGFQNQTYPLENKDDPQKSLESCSELVDLFKVSIRSHGGISEFSVLRAFSSGKWFIVYPSIDRAIIYNHNFVQVRTIPVSIGTACVAVAFCSYTEKLAIADSYGTLTLWLSSEDYWTNQIGKLYEPSVAAVAWLNYGSLVCIGSYLSIYSGNERIHTILFPNKLLQLEAISCAPCFATLCKNSTFVKIWYYTNKRLDFFYLPHPQRVLSISWKKQILSTKRSNDNSGINNSNDSVKNTSKFFLLTNCEDNVARIWSVSLNDNNLPEYFLIATIDGFVHWMSWDAINESFKTSSELIETKGLQRPNSILSGSATKFSSSSVGVNAIKTLQIRNMLKNYSDMVFNVTKEGHMSVWGIRYLESFPMRETRTIFLMQFQNAISNQELVMFNGQVACLPNKGSDLLLMASSKNGRMACWNMNLYDFFAARWTTPKLRLLHQWCGPYDPPDRLYSHTYLPYIILLDKKGGITIWLSQHEKLTLLCGIPQTIKALSAIWIDHEIPIFCIITDNGRDKCHFKVFSYDSNIQSAIELLEQKLSLNSMDIKLHPHIFKSTITENIVTSYLITTHGVLYNCAIEFSILRNDRSNLCSSELMSFLTTSLNLNEEVVFADSFLDSPSNFSLVHKKSNFIVLITKSGFSEVYELAAEKIVKIDRLYSDKNESILHIPNEEKDLHSKFNFDDIIIFCKTENEEVIYSRKGNPVENTYTSPANYKEYKYIASDDQAEGLESSYYKYDILSHSLSQHTTRMLSIFISREHPSKITPLSIGNKIVLLIMYPERIYYMVDNEKGIYEIVATYKAPIRNTFEFSSLMFAFDLPVAIVGLQSGELRLLILKAERQILTCSDTIEFFIQNTSSSDFSSRSYVTKHNCKSIKNSTNILTIYMMYNEVAAIKKYLSVLYNFKIILNRYGADAMILPTHLMPFLEYANIGLSTDSNNVENEFDQFYDKLFNSNASTFMSSSEDIKCIDLQGFDKNCQAKLRELYKDFLNSEFKDMKTEMHTFFNRIDDFLFITSENDSAFDANAKRYILLMEEFLRYSSNVTPNGSYEIDYCPEIYSWAYFSESQHAIVDSIQSKKARTGESLLWVDLANRGFGWWFSPMDLLKKTIEIIARNEYMIDKDPCRCSLMYLALKKKTVLYGLWKVSSSNPEQGATLKFLANDFLLKRWSNAAVKNAFALLGKQRYAYAAAFFILGGQIMDAISVCIKQLKDPQLAIVICRLYCGDDSNELKVVLDMLSTSVQMPNSGQDYLQCIFHFQQKKYEESLLSLVRSPISNDTDAYKLLLYNCLLDIIKLRKNPIYSFENIVTGKYILEKQTIKYLYQKGCPILALNILHGRILSGKIEEFLDLKKVASKPKHHIENDNDERKDVASAFDWSLPVEQPHAEHISDMNKYELFDSLNERKMVDIDEEFEMFKNSNNLGSSFDKPAEPIELMSEEESESIGVSDVNNDWILCNDESIREPLLNMLLQLIAQANINLRNISVIMSHCFRYLRIVLAQKNNIGFNDSPMYLNHIFEILESSLKNICSAIGIPWKVILTEKPGIKIKCSTTNT